MVIVYPFVVSLMDAFFKSIIKLQSEEEKESFQALTDLHEIGLEGKLSEPEGQRNFGGFNYQAYLKTQGIYQTLNIKKNPVTSKGW